jgi:hypothetical protein
MSEIVVQNIENEKNRLNDEINSINSIIANFIPSIENNPQKTSELYILGKFINSLQSAQIEIIEVEREAPDFLIKNNNELIGLEIVEAKNDNIKHKTTADLLEEASKVFAEKHPEIKMEVYFTFKDFELSFNRSNKAAYIRQICDVAYHCYNGVSYYPDFIDDVYILRSGGTRVFFGQIWAGYVNDLNENIIQTLIRKKENLINTYKEKSQTDIQWLLIATSKGAPNSYDIEFVDEMSYSSSFDRVYLLEQITSEVKRLV